MAESTISFRLLETLTTALYGDPIILFREYVQNSLDAYNHMISIDKTKVLDELNIKIVIDKINSSIEISDNGYGIKEDAYLETMKRVGDSTKKQLKDQIGFRGIGRLSAMPLCKELKFENKPLGKSQSHIFKWDGEKFNNSLNKGDDINASIEDITDDYKEDYVGEIDDHYFKVTINGYGETIKDLLRSKSFKERLCFLLPLRYSPEFTKQDLIKEKYLDFIGESLDKFSCKVVLDGEDLFKPYINEDILASDIVFWNLKVLGNGENNPGQKIGLLWFTFDRVIKSRPTNRPYGILVRSKNMLMGDQYALAYDADRSKTDYITTLRELSQALNGVCGEMLINYDNLQDNASRNWFKIDEESVKLRNIIVEFMRRLHEYRYASSAYVNNKTKDNSEQRFILAFRNLKESYDPGFITAVNKLRREIEANKELFIVANEDIPSYSDSIKRFYELVIQNLYNYFDGKGEINEFIKIRKYIKEHLQKNPGK